MKFSNYLKKSYYQIYSFDRYFVATLVLTPFVVLAILAINPILLKISAIILTYPIWGTPLLYFAFQPLTYRIRKVHLRVNLNGVSKKRIVFISDLHLHKFLPDKYVQNYIQEINALQPDLLLLGGDYIVDEYTDLDLLQQLKEFGDFPKLAVLGNHDYTIDGEDFFEDKITEEHFQFAREVQKGLEAVDIRVLRNENYTHKFAGQESDLNIFGIDSIWAKKADPSKYKPGKNNIIVCHNPRILENLDLEKVSLLLSGHNHGGGQIRLNRKISIHMLFALSSFGTPFKYVKEGFGKFTSGIYRNGHNMKMYCSRGIGMTGIAVRINCRPEIVVIDVV